jgi:hypothetical protein
MPSYSPAAVDRFTGSGQALPAGRGGATILVMPVTYELIDAPYPYVCAVYRCECGDVAVRHGNEAATPPESWDRVATDSDDEEFLCPRCVSSKRASDGDQAS